MPIPEPTLASRPPNQVATPCYPGTKTARSTERAVVLSDGAERANETGFPLGKPSEQERLHSINDLTLDRRGRKRKIAASGGNWRKFAARSRKLAELSGAGGMRSGSWSYR